jgi:heme/copper-type cytochrome/quinol oxidase subunit 3
MNINEYKKLEKRITSYNFNKSYKNINTIMTALSYFGNLASIFLAYFFMSQVISGSMPDNPIVVFISSIIILAGIELLKRDIFNKFSIEYLKNKSIIKSAMPLLIASLILIFASFYSSLTGAKEFSSKSKQLEEVKKEVFTEFKDSLTNNYSSKIILIEDEISLTKEQIKLKDKEQTDIESYLNPNKQQRNRISDLKKEKELLRGDITKLEGDINTIKTELDGKLKEKELELSKETEDKKVDNSNNSFMFVILSTIIEFIILFGVYFSEYYKFRSYKEFRDKIEKDPNYQKWLLYDQMLSIIVTEETKVNQKLPSNKAIIENCKVNDIIVLPKDVTDFLKILSTLSIIKQSGSARYISKTKDIAQDILRKNFNIE